MAGAHPRSRGENRTFFVQESWQMGSSPLTRGKRCFDGAPRGARGLIPAHAGKTDRRLDPHRWQRAHPRSRGENLHLQPHARPPAGSSPLTRGKRRGRGDHRRDAGLIPAHAGKTM